MTAKKTPLGGIPITRKEAFAGLGDPKKWKKESDALYAEFNAKPKQAKASLLQRGARKIKTALAAKPKSQLEPVYVKKAMQRAAAKRRKRKLRNRMKSLA